MYVEVRLNGARELLASLTRLEKRIRTGSSSEIGRKLAAEGLRVVVKLTPRQKNTQRAPGSRRGYAPFHTQWQTIALQQTTSNYRAIIRNKAVNSREGLAALAAIEFGAKPHKIFPRRKKMLSWFQPASQSQFVFRSSPRTRGSTSDLRVADRLTDVPGLSGTVFARSVSHPGHRSFRMVQETRDHLSRIASVFLLQYARQIEAEFGAGFRIGVR